MSTTLISTLASGQAPECFTYQAVARDVNGNLLTNQSVTIQFSILENSTTGNAVFVEQHNKTTNDFGLVNLEIGKGIPVTGNFSSIDWESNTYFLKIEIDGEYMGTIQLVSVPYALHAKTVEENDDADADPENELQTLTLNDSTLSLSSGNSVKLPWHKNGDSLYYNSGNVGIGTTSPGAKLDVQEGNISTSGYVLVPNRPAFSVRINQNWTLSDAVIIYDGITVNSGNHYDPVTGRFTAPVSGLYQFSYGGIKAARNESAVSRMNLRLNEAILGPQARASEGAAYGHATVTYILYMNAGDYVDIYNTDFGGWYRHYTYFCGHLL